MKEKYKLLINSILWLIIGFLCFFLLHLGLKRYTLHHKIIHVPSLVGLNLPEVEDILAQHDLSFIILDSAAYNPDYDRGAILSHSPKAGSAVKPHRKIYLTINPLTIHYMPLPDVKNKSLRQGISLLENNAFIIGDLYYTDHFAKDVIRFMQVADTNSPNHGSRVEFNDTLPKFTSIDLYLGNGYVDYVTVPSLIGLGLNDVKAKLNHNSLNIGSYYIDDTHVDTIHNHHFIDTLMIIYKQEPNVNEKVDIGSFINVWAKDTLIEKR